MSLLSPAKSLLSRVHLPSKSKAVKVAVLGLSVSGVVSSIGAVLLVGPAGIYYTLPEGGREFVRNTVDRLAQKLGYTKFLLEYSHTSMLDMEHTLLKDKPRSVEQLSRHMYEA